MLVLLLVFSDDDILLAEPFFNLNIRFALAKLGVTLGECYHQATNGICVEVAKNFVGLINALHMRQVFAVSRILLS